MIGKRIMRKTLYQTTYNGYDYIVKTRDKYMDKFNLNNCTCYIYRVDNNDNKLFNNKEIVEFHYINDGYKDFKCIKKELRKIYEKERKEKIDSFYDLAFFPQIVNNMITCMRIQPDLIFKIMKNFDDSTNYEKALIIKQLYDSAEKIRKYEENNPSLNSPVTDQLDTLKSITDILEEL